MAIDLLAYAQGAEAAQQQNWRDALNSMKMETDALNLRQTEQNMLQRQQAFDIGLPVAKLGAEAQVGNIQEQLNALAGNRRASEFQLGLTTELQNIPREQQADIIAQRAIEKLRSLNTTQPGAAQEAQALNRYLGKVASDYVAAGDVASAQKVLQSLPGADVGGRLQQMQLWSDPQKAFDPVNIEAAGGKVLPDGNIQIGNFKMSPVQFAMIQRARAGDPMANVFPGMQQIYQQNQQREQNLPVLQELQRRYAELGYQTVIDPNSGRIIPLPMAREGFGPQPATGVEQMLPGTMGPPVPLTLNLPGMPTSAATPPFMPPVPGTTAPAIRSETFPVPMPPASPMSAPAPAPAPAATRSMPAAAQMPSDADLLQQMRMQGAYKMEERILGPRPPSVRGQATTAAQREYDAALNTLKNQINGILSDPRRQRAASDILREQGRDQSIYGGR